MKVTSTIIMAAIAVMISGIALFSSITVADRVEPPAETAHITTEKAPEIKTAEFVTEDGGTSSRPVYTDLVSRSSTGSNKIVLA